MSHLSFLLEGVYVTRTKKMGRGVFCKVPIEAGTLIEMAPVIVLSSEERKLIDQTLLHDYIFEWGESRQQCCVALGIVLFTTMLVTPTANMKCIIKKK